MNSRQKIHIVLTILSALLFIPFLGQVHLFDWDEINFAEAAREMLITGDWFRVSIDYQPFWEKPPLFIWMQAVSMKIFGVNEFAARLPNALAGIATINLLFYWGTRFVNIKTGALWALVYLGSITPFFYFKTGIIDPVFNLFIVAGIIPLVQARRIHTKDFKNYLISGIFIGLALLTKGPVGGLVPALVFVAIWIAGRFRWFFNVVQVGVLILVALAIFSLWFLPEMIRNGSGVFSNFFQYQLDLLSRPVASHGQPWYYHAVVLLIGCFPATVFAIPRLLGHDRNNELDRWMLALFWVVLVLFSSVTTKIVHYSSLCWFPLTYLAARQLSSTSRTSPVISFLYALVGTLLSLILVLIPMIMSNIDQFSEQLATKIRDVQVLAILSQNVQWTGWEWLPGGILFLLVMITTIILFLNRFNQRAVIGHFLLMSVIISGVALMVVPRVEKHTQGRIIEFYEKLQGKDVYVRPLHYKSYAHLFYARTIPLDSSNALYKARKLMLEEFGVSEITDLNGPQRDKYNQNMSHYIINNPLDKPVFLVLERKKMNRLQGKSEWQLIYDAGPYVVFRSVDHFPGS